MTKFYLILLAVVITGFNKYSTAQTDGNTVAKKHFEAQHYGKALKEYLKLYENKKNDLEINYNIGFCYLNINDDKSKAIPFLEFVYNKREYKDELLLNLGLAYMYSYKFDEALTFFNEYRKIISSKKSELVENYDEDVRSGKIDYQHKITTGNFGLVALYIENCENAKVLLKRPVNVTFENLGKEVNSKYADFYPFITQNQERLYFTSRREENPLKLINTQGDLTSDIYVSKMKDGLWTKPKNMGPIVNSDANEQCVYVMPNGKKMIIFADNLIGDILTVSLQELPQKPPVKFSEPVNTEYREFEGCITEDKNMLIISSDRSGGLGATDLYMFRKLPNGLWGLPVNLGRQINTKYKEAFPIYDEKNQVLYFASKGHTNMGGFDIFKSKFNTENGKFGPTQNIGYPINTPEDDMVFSLADNGRDGYISAFKKEGLGDLDIYKVILNDVETRPTIVKGVISLPNGTNKEINAVVSLTDAKTGMGDSKKANPQSGKFIFAVETGKYNLKVASPNHSDFEQEINIYDNPGYVFEIEKNILLKETNPPGTFKKEKETLVRGFISITDTLNKFLDVSILDAKTRNTIEWKSINTGNGKFFFNLSPGIYILAISSPGYADFEEELNIGKANTSFEIEKNIMLQTNEEFANPTLEKLKGKSVNPKIVPAKKGSHFKVGE